MSETQEVKAPKGKKVKGQGEVAGNDAPKDAAPRDRTSKNFDKAAVLILVADKNPKRVGSKSHARFEFYSASATVGDFIGLGGTYGDLAWDSARGYITIAGYTPKMVEKKAKAAKKAEAPEAQAAAQGGQ